MPLPQQITRLAHVNQLITHLYDTEKVSFHPDDDFGDIVRIGTSPDYIHTYTPQEAQTRNVLMEQAFTICDSHDVDLYSMCNVEYRLRFMELFQD